MALRSLSAAPTAFVIVALMPLRLQRHNQESKLQEAPPPPPPPLLLLRKVEFPQLRVPSEFLKLTDLSTIDAKNRTKTINNQYKPSQPKQREINEFPEM